VYVLFFLFLGDFEVELICDSTVFIGSSMRTLLMEWVLDGSFIRFALVAVIPFLYCVSLVRIIPASHPSLIFWLKTLGD
jgi:hypothetical protein